MSIKLMAFLKAKQGLSRSAFIARYEQHHVPLVLRIMPGIIDYRRNFLPEDVTDFDAITEIWFADQASFDSAMAAAQQAPGGPLIAADEELVFDRSRTKLCVVQESGGQIVA